MHEPLEHDIRLDNVTDSNYRMWRDSCEVLVPVGESTTKPLMKENVNAKVAVSADIVKGHFKRPHVDYLNTNVYTKLFDHYDLSISRDFTTDPFPPDVIDPHETLGLDILYLYLDVTFAHNQNDNIPIYSFYKNLLPISWLNTDKTNGFNDELWLSEFLFTDYNLNFYNAYTEYMFLLSNKANYAYTNNLQGIYGNLLLGYIGAIPIYCWFAKADLFIGTIHKRILSMNNRYSATQNNDLFQNLTFFTNKLEVRRGV